MTTKSLGQFLLERGAITQEQLIEAVEYQRSKIKPLCDVAVRTGHITPEEREKLETQELREKIHSAQQLESSWRTLSERGVFLVEALTRKGYLSVEELDRLCEEYRQEVTASHINLDDLLPNQPETSKILSSLIENALDLFAYYAGETAVLLSITQAFGEVEDGSYVFTQKISGDLNVEYVLLLPRQILLSIVSHILEEEVKAVDDSVVDVVKEFLSVVVGNTCTKFSMRNYDVRPGAPRAMTEDIFFETLPPDPIVVRASVSEGEFYLAYLVS